LVGDGVAVGVGASLVGVADAEVAVGDELGFGVAAADGVAVADEVGPRFGV
jgi:hypothetical protein